MFNTSLVKMSVNFTPVTQAAHRNTTGTVFKKNKPANGNAAQPQAAPPQYHAQQPLHFTSVGPVHSAPAQGTVCKYGSACTRQDCTFAPAGHGVSGKNQPPSAASVPKSNPSVSGNFSKQELQAEVEGLREQNTKLNSRLKVIESFFPKEKLEYIDAMFKLSPYFTAYNERLAEEKATKKAEKEKKKAQELEQANQKLAAKNPAFAAFLAQQEALLAQQTPLPQDVSGDESDTN